MRTVTELTGIKPDNFMVADFNAVKTLTSAVGGVEVCLGKDINDPDSHLNLPKGTHRIEGEQALAFVRTRHSVGLGGDLSRIELQQQFLSSLMRELKSNDTLTSPSKMIKLAEAATEALTVDSQLNSINKLKDLGMELGKLNVKNLTFTTIPVVDNPAEKIKATVVLDESKAPEVFDLIRNDVSFTEVKQQQKKEKAAVAARLKGEKAPASEVRVRVLNGGAPAGSAQSTLSWLQVDQGVSKSENAGNAPAELAKTTLEYAPDQADQARLTGGDPGSVRVGDEAGRERHQLPGPARDDADPRQGLQGCGRVPHSAGQGAGRHQEVHGGQGRVRRIGTGRARLASYGAQTGPFHVQGWGPGVGRKTPHDDAK